MVFCGNGLESEISECLCGKFCKWTLGKPSCFDPSDYAYSMYGEEFETDFDYDPEDEMAADSYNPINRDRSEEMTVTEFESTTTTTTSTTTTTTQTTRAAKTTTGESTTKKRAVDRESIRAQKQAERKERKESLRKPKTCPDEQWMKDSAVSCSAGGDKMSVCKRECSGNDFNPRDMQSICKCDEESCEWTMSEVN